MMRPLIPLLALSACTGGTVIQDHPERASVPVTIPCVSGARPDAVISLKQQHPGWREYSVKQKTERAAAQALRYKSYGEALNAATGACP